MLIRAKDMAEGDVLCLAQVQQQLCGGTEGSSATEESVKFCRSWSSSGRKSLKFMKPEMDHMISLLDATDLSALGMS